ncbi:hypothetical protein AB0M43_36540 [Longispora sp. NPDC051575]|uniref:hypothetical protein n=1 Tax=Longispora sp. NPDC051575 TaxID=3154943 RepID=UPI00343C08A4
MFGDVDKPPKKATGREVVEYIVEGAVGMVPVVGNPMAVAFAVAMGWTYNRRMRDWLEELAEAVSELQEERTTPLTFEELAEDDRFVDAVVAATRAAQATHAEEKLKALRNGVLSTLGPDAPTLDEQARFFRLVDQFTPAHLRLLAFLDDPGAAFDRASIERPDIYMGGRGDLIEKGLPEFLDRRDWYDLLDRDLGAASLTSHGGLHVMQTGPSLWQPSTSGLGKRFLAFISAPLARKGGDSED